MAKKDKKLYDENGRWVEERGRIKGAIRRAFRLSPQMKEVLQAARVELPPALKKDGTPGKRPQVRYKCAICGELWSQKNVNVDHIYTVVPLWKAEVEMTYDEVVRGVFCDKNNLQVLCSIAMKRNDGKSSCHKKKTDEENWVRRELQKRREEWIVTVKSHEDLLASIEDLKKEYQKHLREQDERRREKARKRKRNSSTDKKS